MNRTMKKTRQAISDVVSYLRGLLKYRWLLFQLVARDNKVKYKRSVLGYFWSLLNPLLMMIVMTAVFSNVFRFDIPNFPVYFLCGNLLFSFFQEATTLSMSSLIAGAGILKKAYIPKYILPLSRTLSSFVNLGCSLGALFLILFFTGTPLRPSMVFLPFPILYCLLFSVGVSLFMSILATFFRDALHLYGVFTMALMYLTPIFYPVEVVPEEIQRVILWNPLYYFVSMMRDCVLNGVVPSPADHAVCLLFVTISLTAGLCVFRKNQGKIFLYI